MKEKFNFKAYILCGLVCIFLNFILCLILYNFGVDLMFLFTILSIFSGCLAINIYFKFFHNRKDNN